MFDSLVCRSSLCRALEARAGWFRVVLWARRTVTRRVLEGGSGCIRGGMSERSSDKEDECFDLLEVLDRGGVSRFGEEDGQAMIAASQ